ncbi:hypothetical protein [Psychromonas aquatilis]|uniref:FG-GAP repeat protein n=1 Tax=Psychromonas aquatilis TaxID=2005072 RepID=A0ABU9GNH8_9GAMM
MTRNPQRNPFNKAKLPTLVFALSLAGCGGGGGGGGDEGSSGELVVDDTPIEQEIINDNFDSQATSGGVEINSGDFNLSTIEAANTRNEDGSGNIRQINFTWENAFPDTSNNVIYTICQSDILEAENCNELGTTVNTYSFATEVTSVLDTIGQHYFVIADNGAEQLISSEKAIHPGEFSKMAGYFKASNSGYADDFGKPVVISADGLTMAVAAVYEDSPSSGINGDQGDSASTGATGAVYIFSSDGNNNWKQTAYIKASAPDSQDYFGTSLDINEDGTVLVVGAPGEDSGDASDESDNSVSYSGATYVFNYDGANWNQSAYLKNENPEENDHFGTVVSLSLDGNRLAVSSPFHTSTEGGSIVVESGSVSLFDFNGSEWESIAYLESHNQSEDDRFGHMMSLSGDGETLAVASFVEDSSETGINGTGFNDEAESAGAVYIFHENNVEQWEQTSYLKASNAEEGDYFGNPIKLSDDGEMLAVGATYEDSSNNEGQGAGAVYLFNYNGSTWNEVAYLKGSNTEGASEETAPESALDASDDNWGDHFGNSIAFNGDATVLAIGSSNEDSATIGINWDESDNTAKGAGAVYMFAYDETSQSWEQTAYVKAPNTEEIDSFGSTVDLSQDGKTLVVAAHNESSGETGINSEDTNRDDDDSNDENYSGAVYVF